MTRTTKPFSFDRLPTWSLLLLGAALSALTGPRWQIAALAWVAPVPYLMFARRAHGWRPWLALLGVTVTAACLQTATIVTAPVPLAAVLGFGPPLGLGWSLSIAGAEWARRRVGEGAAVFSFAALTAVTGWLGYGAAELGVWMAAANGQVEQLALMQLASVVGLGGIGFLMGWVAALAAWLAAGPRGVGRAAHVVGSGIAVCGALLWGSLRLDQAGDGRTVTVAAVVTDVGLGPEGLPDATVLAANTDRLFERTRLAANRGARLIVWNEAATLVEPRAEAALVARGQQEARALGVDIVLAYAVILERAPLLLDNKHAFITSEGQVADVYRKHHPVPGEPSLRGEGPLRVLDRPYARVGAAICYDYDFPAMAREHARAGAELVVVPASDWRVWGLRDSDGWVVSSSMEDDREDADIMPFWSDRAYAKRAAQEEWSRYEPTAIPLEEFMNSWLPGMDADGTLVGTNWDAHNCGVEMEPLALLKELRAEIDGLS